MNTRSEKLLGNMLDAKNFDPSSETKVSQKGKTLYSKRRNNVQSGTRQQNAQMFDHLKSINCS